MNLIVSPVIEAFMIRKTQKGLLYLKWYGDVAGDLPRSKNKGPSALSKARCATAAGITTSLRGMK